MCLMQESECFIELSLHEGSSVDPRQLTSKQIIVEISLNFVEPLQPGMHEANWLIRGSIG
jgi:hypothetical protein